MIIVNTGEGKGKTTAAVGQAMRALGQGLDVAFAQFMKRDNQAGEQAMLRNLLGDAFFAGGKGFFRSEKDRDVHRQAALEVLTWAQQKLDILSKPSLLVLDESLYALGAGLLLREEIESLLDKSQTAQVHVLLTGRGLPDWLLSRADLVTEMVMRKHPHEQGVKAQKGIEF